MSRAVTAKSLSSLRAIATSCTLVSAQSSVAGIRDSHVLVPLVYFDTLKQKMHFLSYTLRCSDKGSSLIS